MPRTKQIQRWRDFASAHGLNPKDRGVDLVLITKDGEYYAVQVKHRSDKNDKLTRNDLATFLVAETIFHPLPLAGYILVTDTPLTTDAEDLCNARRMTIINFDSRASLSRTEHKERRKLRPYQREAVQRVLDAFNAGTSRGKLIMPPGTGKTFVALNIAEHYKRILFLAPSIALIDQSLRTWLDDASEPMRVFAVVSASGVGKTADDDPNALTLLSIPTTTNSAALADGLAEVSDDQRVVVFSTYQSVEVICEAQRQYGVGAFALIVFDKAHRTAIARRGEPSSVWRTTMNMCAPDTGSNRCVLCANVDQALVFFCILFYFNSRCIMQACSNHPSHLRYSQKSCRLQSLGF